MNHRFVLALLASILLSACGRGGEDFALKIGRPSSKVVEAFGHAHVSGQMAMLFPGLKVVRTEPVPGEVLYTIPGDGEFPSTIKLTFESTEDGKATVLHAAIDTPRTEVEFEGKSMVISESKVEKMIGEVLRKAAAKLENGESIESEKGAFSAVLTILAVITDSKRMRQMKDMAKYPEWYMSGLGWLLDDGDGAARAYGDPAVPEDPNVSARHEERDAKEKAEAAAAPMDDAQGDAARGEDAGGSDY